MAKLKGAAKRAFLARMNKGRMKAGLKKIGSSLKRAKPRSRSTKMAKQKLRYRAKKVGLSFNKGFKGFLAGNGASELSDELTTFVTVDPRIKIPVKLMAGAAGGYYASGTPGLIGGLAAAGLDIGLSMLNGKDFGQSITQGARL